MSKGKKIVVLSAMITLLIASGVLNFIMSGSTVINTNDVVSVSSFYSSYRADRDTTRNQTILELQAIIDSENTSQEAKSAAETMLLNICENMETELVLESLIKAKGFSDVAVTISSRNVNVVVNASELETSQIAQILNIVTAETDKSASSVAILPYGTDSTQ